MASESLSETSTTIVEAQNHVAKNESNVGLQHETPNRLRWLQVVSAFLMNFNSWGIVNAYGVYQSYYTSTLLSSHSLSDLSWIGTLQGFLLLLTSVVAGPLFDRGHARPLVIGGSFLVVFGMMMTSLSTQYYQIVLAQGIAVGLGAGCLFTSSITNVQLYFQDQRALATGLTSTGGSIGGIVYSIALNNLLTAIGFAWATRVLGFIALATSICSIVLFRPHPSVSSRTKTPRALFDISALRLIPFDIFCIGLFFLYTGLYIPFLYASLYSQAKLHTSPSLSFDMVTFLNVGAIIGRVLGGFISDRYKCALLLQTFCGAVAGLLAFCWIAVRNVAGMIVFTILYGACQGIIVALPPAIIANMAMARDPTRTGTWIGIGMMFSGLGVLVGSPIGGALVMRDQTDFLGLQVFAGAVIAVGTCTLCAHALVQRRC